MVRQLRLTQVGAGVCEQFSRTKATQVVSTNLNEEARLKIVTATVGNRKILKCN